MALAGGPAVKGLSPEIANTGRTTPSCMAEVAVDISQAARGGSFPGVEDLGMHDIVFTGQLGRPCTYFSQGEYAEQPKGGRKANRV